MKITISRCFKDIIYPLSQEELAVLEQSILKHGVRDPLVVWSNGRDYLIDGHHRKLLIDRHRIKKYKVTKLKFNNKHEVINWILDNQIGRRNATPEGISYLRGLRYKNTKKNHGGDRKSTEQNVHLTTAQQLADQYKISHMTIQRDEKFADSINTIIRVFSSPKKQKDIKYQILTRQINLSKKDIVELAELSPRYIKQVIGGKKELWQVKLEIEQRRKKRKKKPVRIILPKEVKIYLGDCLKVLPKLEENSIHSAVVDPSYGIGFMGNSWDNFKPSNIDKYKLIERAEFIGDRSPALKAGLYDMSLAGAKKYQKFCEDWGRELLRVIRPGGHCLIFNSPKNYHRMVCGFENVGWEPRNTLMWLFLTGFPVSMSISKQIDKLNGTKSKIVCENPNRRNRLNWDQNPKNIVAPMSDEALTWEGWGTHLKNSFEPILLARKPLAEKTVAENVLKWEVGALNIDGCRIADSEGCKAEDINKAGLNGEGRHPANLILSEEAGEELDNQAGQQASQFFYCPKPSLAERNFGCSDLSPKKQNSDGGSRTYNDRCATCGKKFIGPKTKICHCPAEKKITDKDVYTNPNNHPCIKPVKLMEYLTRLVTPPGGTVIDCFAGSGTTGMACAYNNFKFVGVEKEKSYLKIARRRIMAAYRKQQGK